MKNKFDNLETDRALLRAANQELEEQYNKVNRLELAVEFGRCVDCNEPLLPSYPLVNHLELCDDCTDTKIDDLNDFIKTGI